jgi:hypothetical protein
MARRDPMKIARLREAADYWMLLARAKYGRHLYEVATQPEYAATKYADRSVLTGVALKFAELAHAESRATKAAETPRLFGMVMMQPRIEAHDAWEQMAAKEHAIEIPGQVIQRGVGIGPISGELGERIPPADDGSGTGTGDAARGEGPDGNEPK